LVHGQSGLLAAQRATDIFFGAEIGDLTDQQLVEIFADVPRCGLQASLLENEGYPLIDALVACGLCKSKSDGRRAIDQGGIYVNNRRREGIESRLERSDLASESMIVLRSGKKKYALLRFLA